MSIETTLKQLYSMEGKVVLLTGAGGGICSMMAQTLAGAGATMALCDVRKDVIEEQCRQLEGTGHTCHYVDLTSDESLVACVDEVIAAHGRVDVLINGAGVSKRIGMLDVDEKLYDLIMDINLRAAFRVAQEVVRKTMRFTGGKILNIASYNSTSVCGGSSVYAMSKSGILGLTRSMAVEWGKFNIQANAIAPGFIETPLTAELKNDPVRYNRIVDMTCCRRMAQPEELMGMTLLLVSPSSSYITGHVFNVDGGALIGAASWPFPTAY